MTLLAVGDQAPEITARRRDGSELTLSSLRGRHVLVYFYPKDDTPGCTLEGREFTSLLDEFRAAGIDVYGVSPDSVHSHDRFAAKCELGIPLVSDPDHVLIDPLGLWVEKSRYGRTYHGVQRSTFLVDGRGEVEREWRAVTAGGHAAAVLEASRSAG